MSETPHRRESDNSTEGRLTAVESAVEHLDESMRDIKRSISSGFSELHSRMNRHNEQNKPHVLAWAGWAAVLLMVVGMFGSVIYRDILRVEDDVQKIQDHRISFADPVQDKQIEYNRFNFQKEDSEIRVDLEELADRVTALDGRSFDNALKIAGEKK